jgi:hypothetical protein
MVGVAGGFLRAHVAEGDPADARERSAEWSPVELIARIEELRVRVRAVGARRLSSDEQEAIRLLSDELRSLLDVDDASS